MASPKALAELTRQCRQNRNDIEATLELLKGTNKAVKANTVTLNDHTARFDQIDTRFDGLDTKVDHLTTRVDGLDTKVDHLTTRVDGLDVRFDELDTKVDNRFDRLEKLITERSASQPTTGVMRTPHEKKGSILEQRVDVYSSQTAEARDEIARHNRMFDAYDDRFNTLDTQMTEVLGILRGTGT